ncbi:MAG: molybdate ABC transporter permease subunit [Myxococcales bacterium]|nr:MAG: molybdate ABC transporter permease subunit [Myxococcales bacterium]
MQGVNPISAIWLSLQVGVICVAVATPVAIALGWLLSRKSFPGKSFLGTLLQAPLVLPPVVTGLILLSWFGKNGFLGRGLAEVGIFVPFGFLGCVVAGLIMGLPLYVMAARAVFDSIDPIYENVSATLGHTPWRTFRRVTLPLAAPGLVGGAVLCFMRALGEFGATAVLAGNMEGKTRTISLAVYTLLEVPEGEAATNVLILASLGLSLAALFGYERLNRYQRRRLDLPDAAHRWS